MSVSTPSEGVANRAWPPLLGSSAFTTAPDVYPQLWFPGWIYLTLVVIASIISKVMYGYVSSTLLVSGILFIFIRRLARFIVDRIDQHANEIHLHLVELERSRDE